MLFPTVDFAIFFSLVFLGHWLLNPFPRRWKLFMIAASYLFYAWWDWRLVWLLAAASLIAQAGALAVARTASVRKRRAAMGVAVVALLGLLGWFKYYGFFALNVANAFARLGHHSPVPLLQVTLPVGISFYTFMAISYVVDVYRGVLEPAGWLDTFVYLSFFPHLVAGPIVRGGELIPQLQRRRDPRRVDVGRAAYLIWSGLFKKVVLSSFLASAIVDPVFGNPAHHTSLEILFAIYGYAVQIYADFSGYSDMAIGVALLLGFKFPQNFNAPYTARSLQDFWRRWHMTLSRWIRDYIYIPLGGSRVSERRTYLNIMLTMALAGLWHGAAWTFVAWGLFHGAGLALGRRRQKAMEGSGVGAPPDTPTRRLSQRVITFHLVCLGWVFFRSESFGTAIALLRGLVTSFGPAPAVTPLVIGAIALGVGAQYLPADLSERLQVRLSAYRPMALGALLGIALFVITALGPHGVAPFIYYRF